jgi:DNA-binding XRE family transcriptional regulator
MSDYVDTSSLRHRSGRFDMDQPNNVKKLREEKMLSKAELARMAGISPLTLDRIERGKACRMATKRKILLALGLKTNQKQRVFKL